MRLSFSPQQLYAADQGTLARAWASVPENRKVQIEMLAAQYDREGHDDEQCQSAYETVAECRRAIRAAMRAEMVDWRTNWGQTSDNITSMYDREAYERQSDYQEDCRANSRHMRCYLRMGIETLKCVLGLPNDLLVFYLRYGELQSSQLRPRLT